MSISKKLINLFVFPALLLLFSLIFMGSADAAHSGGIVTVSCLHFREEPNTTSTSLALAYDGDEVIITGQEGDWYSVIFNGVSGYMFSDYVRPVGTLYIEPVSARVTANRVRFRSGPAYEAEVLHYLDTDTQLKVLGIIDCWYEVTYGETTGYMHSDYVEIFYDEFDHLTPGQKIVEYAKQFLDTRYVYGGSSIYGFDCSGFTSYVLKHNGYDSTRTCTSQYAQYTNIERSELRIGDLVFFASPKHWDTDHVGIYMGDNLFIHASSGKGKVVISSLDETYYNNYYYGAARYLPFY